MNKKIISAVMAISVALSAVPFYGGNPVQDYAVTASAEDYTEGTYENLTYYKYDDHIEISGCDKSAEEVVIPAEIEGLPVTSIGEFAFSYCSKLESITIPDNVISIGGYSFFGTPWFEAKVKENKPVIINNVLIYGRTCEGEVVIPDGVKSIGARIFYECVNLTSIIIPDSVTTIRYGAFEKCLNLKSITILNPNCEIYDDSVTICNAQDYYNWNNYFYGTIYGYENSTAQAYAEKYGYNFEAMGEIENPETLLGDANCDGEVSVADATLVLQYCGNKDKYKLSEQGLINADVDGTAGISAVDALRIQQYDAGVIENF